MAALSLRTRLLLAYAALILLGFGGLAWLAGAQIAAGAQEDAAQALTSHAGLMARSLAGEVNELREHAAAPAAVEAVAEHAAALAAQVGADVALYDGRGLRWYDSTGAPPDAAAPGTAERRDGDEDDEDYTSVQLPPDLPREVAAALEGRAATDRRTDAAGELILFAAAPLREDDHLLGAVQLALPTAVTTAAVRHRWIALAGWVALLTGLALAASLYLAASLTRPLEALRRSALKLAAGNLAERIPTGPATQPQNEIGQVAAAFNHMAGQVQAMVEEQRAFAGNAAHELRTPLTTIRLRSEALRSGELDPTLAHQYIAEIDDEAARLGDLVEDLILLSRLDAGRAQRGSEAVDVVRLARALVRDTRSLPEAEGKTVTLAAPAELPPLDAATGHLRVLLRNLLTNAVLYTPPGGTITCRLAAVDGTVVMAVADNGQGIAPEDLPHVRERFYRADRAHTRAVKGAGLGLALVQSIVDFYGAQFTIASPGLGQGTTVTVTWPTSPAA